MEKTGVEQCLYVPKLILDHFSVIQMLDKVYIQSVNIGQSLFKTSDQK